ncbi:MAG: hypothetical protein B6D41_01245 [Chloroflexi bacterium UTCFX4]|jgi:Zn-dependent peptidase ImmA (M78 family)/DNA-binding XRE family transcriptional regulator|nr:MAG: hypothetical protein B6D41_01245 [Chloroflexi bacterium UTCFX4]
MPGKSIEVGLNPAVLRWARTSAGWSIEEIAEKLKIKPDTYKLWESGEIRPTLANLKKLAEYFKRPLAVFFLPEPPHDPPLPTDFRKLFGEPSSLSKESLLAVRRARRLQNIATELMRGLDHEMRPLIGTATLEENPDDVAREERARLGITVDDQRRWRDQFEAVREWRRSVENLNVLVFRFSMPVTEARGFSLDSEKPPVIVINSTDAAHAQIFTLFHEYAHLLLRMPGICDPERVPTVQQRSDNVEIWCNRFAASLLVPSEELHQEVFEEIARSPESSADLLKKISRRFKVSTEVILRRMYSSRLLTKSKYEEGLDKLVTQRIEPKKDVPFPQPIERQVLQERGELFTSLVLEGRERDLIGYGDVADYLSLRLKHLDKLQALVAA